MHYLKGDKWQPLDTANSMLLPKKNEAVDTKYYRPMSLVHSAAKVLCRVLARRLALGMQKLVSSGQRAFICERSIQDNFMYVKNVIKEAHVKKSPLIFLNWISQRRPIL